MRADEEQQVRAARRRRGRRSSARGPPSRTGRGRRRGGCPSAASHEPTDRWSHSAARAAVHGASSGTLLRHPVDAVLRERDRRDRERADLRDQARVPTDAVAVDEQVRAGDVRLVRGDAELARQAEDRVVAGSEPRAAAVDRGAVRRAARSRCGRRRGRALRAPRPIGPAWWRRSAAVSPAYPAPMTQTSAASCSVTVPPRVDAGPATQLSSCCSSSMNSGLASGP